MTVSVQAPTTAERYRYDMKGLADGACLVAIGVALVARILSHDMVLLVVFACFLAVSLGADRYLFGSIRRGPLYGPRSVAMLPAFLVTGLLLQVEEMRPETQIDAIAFLPIFIGLTMTVISLDNLTRPSGTDAR